MKMTPVIGDISYSAIEDRFGTFRMSAPLSLCYQVNTYCNYRCAHCLSSSGLEGSNGLSTSSALGLIDIVCAAGVRRINITGGEPLLRKDVVELCSHIRSKGAEVVVTTNGSQVTENLAAELAKHLDFLQISLDGPEAVNDKLRHPGSFARAVAAIKTCQDAGLAVRINCTIQNGNRDQIPYMLNLARQLQVNGIYFIMICSQGRASGSQDFLFDIDDEIVLSEELKTTAQNHAIDVKILDFRRYAKSCVLVTPEGDLVSQGWSDLDCINTGNIFERGFSECWHTPGAFDHLLHLIKNVRHPLLYS